VWTTDKDGIVSALLAAEIAVHSGRDPGELYRDLTEELGDPVYDRIEAPATAAQKTRLTALSPNDIKCAELAGEAVESVVNQAPGNQEPLGGIKVSTSTGWFAARPSGTEDIYKIYAESFQGREHLDRIVAEAQAIVDTALAAGPTEVSPRRSI
jgi:phosphoglucomutase